MKQKVNLYGTVIDVTEAEAEGVIDYLYGRNMATQEAPEGFAMAPPDADDEWRRGYALGVFGVAAQINDALNGSGARR
jgi:hypothetical protein